MSYGAIRRSFDRETMELMAWELIVRLKHAGFEIDGAACYERVSQAVGSE